ncbi:MAG: hypothetical protein NTX72_01370 [Candidatus Uhrbacteria bacterium]|nr:hypothetical protein [Candidatus Uhrbacteria bacterium]
MSDLIREPAHRLLLSNNRDPITHLTLSPDEQTLACMGKQEHDFTAIHFFNPQTEKELCKPYIQSFSFKTLQWSKNGERLYATTPLGKIFFLEWQENKFKQMKLLYEHARGTNPIHINGPTYLTILVDDLIAFITQSGLICVMTWDGQKHVVVHQEQQHCSFSGIIPSTNPSMFLSTCGAYIQLFGDTGNNWICMRQDPPLENGIQKGAWTQDRTWIFLLPDRIVLDRRDEKRIVINHGIELEDLLVVNNETILVSTKNPNYILAVQIPDGKILFDMGGFVKPVTSMCLFDLGRYLMTNTANHIPFCSRSAGDHSAQIFDFGSANLGRNNTPFITDLPV